MLDQKIDSMNRVAGSRPETEPKEPSQAGIHVLSDKEHSSHPLEDAHGSSPPQYHRVDLPRDYYLAQPPQSAINTVLNIQHFTVVELAT